MIDTNVLLDDILNRASNAEAARTINELITDGVVTGYLTANCLTDIFYIVSKNKNEATARKVIRNLLLFLLGGERDGRGLSASGRFSDG